MRRMNLNITDHLIGTASYNSEKKQFQLSIPNPDTPLTRFMLVLKNAVGTSMSKPYFVYGASIYRDILYTKANDFTSSVDVAVSINRRENTLNLTLTINTTDSIPNIISNAILYVYGV